MRRAAQQYGLREAGDNDDWTLYWTDYSVSLERVMEMKSYQVCPRPWTCGTWPVVAWFVVLALKKDLMALP